MSYLIDELPTRQDLSITDRAEVDWLVSAFPDYQIDYLNYCEGWGVSWFRGTKKSTGMRVRVLYENTKNSYVLERLKQRIDRICLLSHPNLLLPIDKGELGDGALYVVTPLIKGCTLETLIRSKTFSLPEFVDTFDSILDSIFYLHSNDAFYPTADLSCILFRTNNLGTRELQLEVIDTVEFGGLFQSHRLYDGPEFWLEGEPQKQRSTVTDIYSLGLLLYHALTLENLFEGPSQEQCVLNISSRPPDLKHSLIPMTPSQLDKYSGVIHKCLKKSIDQRYQSLDELRADLLNS